MTTHHKLLILGSGPAGYTAAIYAARANLNPVIITGMEQGGQLTKTHLIENWPGEAQGISGIDLMQKMLNQAERFDSKIVFDHIVSSELNKKPFYLKGENDEYTCDALIIATGASAKYLGLPSEEKFMGKGVSACAVCDGYFYKNTKVAVIGGSNTAVEDALYLAKIAKEVTLIHRRDSLRAEDILVKQLMAETKTGNIKIVWNSNVQEILGDDSGVTGIRIKNTLDNSLTDLDVKGIFIAVGHQPNSNAFKNQLEMDNDYIKIKSGSNGNFTATNIPGIFAAGDVADQVYRQAVTASAMGCMAALDVKKYLQK